MDIRITRPDLYYYYYMTEYSPYIRLKVQLTTVVPVHSLVFQYVFHELLENDDHIFRSSKV